MDAIRDDFPILHQHVNGKPLIYFDNAATTQKPRVVIDTLVHYYQQDNANIHRGNHTLADRATAAFENTRKLVQAFIGAEEAATCIFTKGTTEGINLVAQTFGRSEINQGDEILISEMEHHSNIVPWQMLCAQKGAVLKVVPISDEGELLIEAYESLLSERTKIVSIVYVSNALGSIQPMERIIQKAHAVGAKVLIDAAQAVAHLDMNVQALDCDFLVFSAHKLYGPTGVGVLYGKRALLEQMPPYQGGGEMIKEVSFEETTWNEIPYKFEAGTPNIGDVIAFGSAINYITRIGKQAIAAHESQLLTHFSSNLAAVSHHVQLIGTAQNKIGVQSFVINGIHAFDAGLLLDAKGIAVRTGHHCTQPLMKRLGLEGTIRASFAMYNTFSEVDTLLAALEQMTSKLK